MLLSRPIKILASIALLAALSSPAPAKVVSVDPAQDFKRNDSLPPVPPPPTPTKSSLAQQSDTDDVTSEAATTDTVPATTAPNGVAKPAADGTYGKDDLISAAEGVFGKGAAGLAGLVEKILKDQGQPNAYIAGREASGAFVVGLRYGSGLMNHGVEGERKVYWTGPSIGFDAGGDASKVFVLVYNLYDSQDLYKRFPQVEGRAFYVGGLSGTYLRRGRIAMIPIRVGVGARLGANVGYMKFSEKAKWLPF